MGLIGFVVLTPLIALLMGVCYIGYASVRVLNVFGIIPIVFFCAPAGYGLICLIRAMWILFD